MYSSRVQRPITFSIEKEGPGLARAGTIHTPHGTIETPAFVAVGTKATVKGIPADEFKRLGVGILIANTYHLYLSPGEELVERAGGVGKFMGWPGPTMTDSGGFQVFSLGAGIGRAVSKFIPEARPEEDTALNVWSEEVATAHGKLAIVDDDGVTFTSHLDGSLHRFTPERSIEIQHRLGADIIFAFDECTAPTAPREYQEEAMHRTHEWARRSLDAHRRIEYESIKAGLPAEVPKGRRRGIFGIVQGGRYADLRKESAATLGTMDFDGYGIGGSFSKDDMLSILEVTDGALPRDMPRHLLGIGEPEDVLYGVRAGIDTFDCVLPTRNGRNGTLFTRRGKINITRARFREDFGPLDHGCDCSVCVQHTRAYLHHLFRTNEMLGPVLASMHNVRFLARLGAEIRTAILAGRFDAFAEEFLASYKNGA